MPTPHHCGSRSRPSVSELIWASVSSARPSASFGALSTTVALSWFRRERAAGLIAPLLLVVNGGQAAAAASGTESALFTLSATFSFLALESGWSKRLSAMLVVLCATRPEGVIFVLGFALLSLTHNRDQTLLKRLIPFAPAFLWLALIAVLRYLSSGQWLSPVGIDLIAVSAERSWQGIEFVLWFARCQVTPVLVLAPVGLLLLGKLPAIGGRSLFLGMLWTSVVVAQGGRSLPFGQVMLPALPFFFIAIQAAMFKALDRVGLKRKLALVALATATLLSGLASRTPSDLGPFPLHRVYDDWFGAGISSKFQSRGHMGRIGLAEEIRDTRRLRNIALFLRDYLEPDDKVLTPWPASAGYLSRLKIIDLFGRTHLWPGQEHLRSWVGIPRVDVEVALQSEPDYIVFSKAPLPNVPGPSRLAASWVEQFDERKNEPGRVERVSELLKNYEAIAVPVAGLDPRGDRGSYFYFLLRRKGLVRRPQLQTRLTEDRFLVEVRHTSHQQICDLRVSLEDDQGTQVANRSARHRSLELRAYRSRGNRTLLV